MIENQFPKAWISSKRKNARKKF